MSGQHYSENMKDTFFNQLDVPKPNYEFTANKKNDSTIVSSTIENLFNHFESNKYKAAVFLGDPNSNGINCCCTTQYTRSSY